VTRDGAYSARPARVRGPPGPGGLGSDTTPAGPLPPLSPAAEAARGALGSGGALFFDDLLARLQLLPSQLETALSELAGQGLAACDGFAGLRALCARAGRRRTPEVRAAQMAAVPNGGFLHWLLIPKGLREYGSRIEKCTVFFRDRL